MFKNLISSFRKDIHSMNYYNLFWYFIYPFIQNQFLWNKIILYIYIYITTNNNNKSYCYPYSFIWFLEHLEHTKLFLSFFYFLGVPEGDFKSFSNQLTSKVHPVTKPNALWNLSQFIGTLDQKNWRISFYPFKQLYFVT